MKRDRPFEAVIADTDGVLTPTAALHERAWKLMFDAFLSGRAEQSPFRAADYHRYVDGKPRYAGVADFLSSRGISLPQGQPSDGTEQESISGLGNRKNELFLHLLGTEGVPAFEDARTALARWRRGGLALAAISASRNCRRVLKGADLESYVDHVVDGQVAQQLGLKGKQEILTEAAHRLERDPSDIVVFEDAVAGIQAAKSAGFGLVVGIDRADREAELAEAGADRVAKRLSSVRFLRRVPRVLDRLDELRKRKNERPLAVFLDFDGTLAPIVDNPRDARVSDQTRAVLGRLSDCCPVAVLSGRDRDDVAARVGLPNISYVGNHGLSMLATSHDACLPDADQTAKTLAGAANELERRLERAAGVFLERKRFSVVVHFRQLQDEQNLGLIQEVVDEVSRETGLRRRQGKKVLELEATTDWDKGRALRRLVANLPDGERSFSIYVGDDETDEDAFAALTQHEVGVRVDGPISTSLADYSVADPEGVRNLLQRLIEHCNS